MNRFVWIPETGKGQKAEGKGDGATQWTVWIVFSAAMLMVAAGGVLPCGAEKTGGETGGRVMPFRSRDAVVRESPETVRLVGADVVPGTWIVTGESAPGPREAFHNQQIDRAAVVLTTYLEKITNVTCRILHTPEQASDARLALLVRGYRDMANRAPR
ncbi:MAG: hypothetical protein QGI83_22715, partial [Candidatus Latescibacteria bacterium]|nr:hypothetical protein [Candidatus Latescibacterota bacterium]